MLRLTLWCPTERATRYIPWRQDLQTDVARQAYCELKDGNGIWWNQINFGRINYAEHELLPSEWQVNWHWWSRSTHIRYLGISSQATYFSATANDIFCVAENGLQWKACTDAAFSNGKVRGFIANMKEVNPKISSPQWLVYYNANDAKIPPAVHKNVLTLYKLLTL